MAVVSGYRNLLIASSVEKGKEVLVNIAGDLYQCKRVTYDSKDNVWEVEDGRLVEYTHEKPNVPIPPPPAGATESSLRKEIKEMKGKNETLNREIKKLNRKLDFCDKLFSILVIN